MSSNFNKEYVLDGVDITIPVKTRRNRKNIKGLKFGKLTPIKPVIADSKGNSRWLCECDCGNLKVVETYKLTSGNTKSCGCLKKEHGHFLKNNYLEYIINRYEEQIKQHINTEAYLQSKLKEKEIVENNLRNIVNELKDKVQDYEEKIAMYEHIIARQATKLFVEGVKDVRRKGQG